MVRNAPLHETADDPRAARAAYARHEAARFTLELLLRATGAWPCVRGVDAALLAERAQARAAALEHFALLTSIARRQWGARWQPSATLVRAMKRSGLSVSEVEEAARAL